MSDEMTDENGSSPDNDSNKSYPTPSSLSTDDGSFLVDYAALGLDSGDVEDFKSEVVVEKLPESGSPPPSPCSSIPMKHSSTSPAHVPLTQKPPLSPRKMRPVPSRSCSEGSFTDEMQAMKHFPSEYSRIMGRSPRRSPSRHSSPVPQRSGTYSLDTTSRVGYVSQKEALLTSSHEQRERQWSRPGRVVRLERDQDRPPMSSRQLRLEYSKNLKRVREGSPLRHVSRSPSPVDRVSQSPRRVNYYAKHPVSRSNSRTSYRDSPPRCSPRRGMVMSPRTASPVPSRGSRGLPSPRSLDTQQVVDTALAHGRRDLVFELADFVEEMNNRLQDVIAQMPVVPIEGYPTKGSHTDDPHKRRLSSEGSKGARAESKPGYSTYLRSRTGVHRAKPKPVETKEMLEHKKWTEVKNKVTRERREREHRRSLQRAESTQRHSHRSMSPAQVHPKPLSPRTANGVRAATAKSPTRWFQSSKKP